MDGHSSSLAGSRHRFDVDPAGYVRLGLPACSCDKHREFHLADTTSRPTYVVTIGDVYWIDDPKVRVGEWSGALVVDHTLARILSRPSS
jgi:hypothetical protein